MHVTHGIRAQAIGHGARVLAGAIPYLPVGVHLAVVDPGVGSGRHAIALRSGDGRLFVGPDNGLLIPAAEACGGIVEAHEISNPDVMLHPVSRTFHARDIFSPATGHLAAGMPSGRPRPGARPGRPRAPRRRRPRDRRLAAHSARCSTSTGSATSSSRCSPRSSTASSSPAGSPRSSPPTTATTCAAPRPSPTSDAGELVLYNGFLGAPLGRREPGQRGRADRHRGRRRDRRRVLSQPARANFLTWRSPVWWNPA